MRVNSIKFKIFLWALAFSGTAWGAFDRRLIYQFELAKSTASPVAGKLAPNQVFLKWIPELEIWGFVQTNDQGEFTKPLEVLDSGSVIAGSSLGSKEKKAFYRLSTDGLWVKAERSNFKKLIVLSEPIKTKAILATPLGLTKVGKSGGDYAFRSK